MDYNKATGEWQLCYNWRRFCDPLSEANCVTRPSDRIPCTEKSYSREIELFKTSGKSLWFPKKAETSYERVSQFNAWLDEDFASATARTTYSLMRSSAHITAYWLATSRGSHPLVRSPCVGGQVLCRFRLGLKFCAIFFAVHGFNSVKDRVTSPFNDPANHKSRRNFA